MKISASIVLYKTDPLELEHVYSCLDQSGTDYKLIVVDNSPDDRLKNILKGDNVSYIFTGQNSGYGRGHNLAMKELIDESEYHLILNVDISFLPNVIPAMVKYMNQHPDVGQMMPKILFPNGEIQYLCKLIPTPLDLIFRRFLPSSLLKSRKEKFQLQFTGYNRIMEVPYLSGCFMLLRTSVIKEIGFFDERFFMYPEDIDLTRRIHEKYKTIYFPEVSVIHNHAKESYRNGNLLLVHIINMIRYFNKWGWIFDRKRRCTNRKILKVLNYDRI